VNIDTSFDYWADLNPGLGVWDAKGSNDPDTQSLPLQTSHRTLWTKRLPNGEMLALEPSRGTQLQWGGFRLSSDSISNSYMTNRRMRPVVLLAQSHAEELFRWGSRIGGYILFPGYRVNGKATINAARGMNRKIDDRIDLTLEAIRRHYLSQESPLSDVLARYSDFFDLFIDFESYVRFWLLDDLLDDQRGVRYFLPFDNFTRNAAPISADEYVRLQTATLRFLQARTDRIRAVSAVLRNEA
jgi:hypothetical protein